MPGSRIRLVAGGHWAPALFAIGACALLLVSSSAGSGAARIKAAAISAGGEHTCALTRVGGVKCWGHNDDGQLGDGTEVHRREAPVGVSGLSGGVTAISAGDYHSCVLTDAGAVLCWGLGGDGELGDGTGTERHTPVGVSGLNSGVIAIAAGAFHTCALTSVGGVACWGSNDFGELGDGTTRWRPTPVAVSGLASGVIALAAGDFHTCALTSVGGVKCWGDNGFGEIGDGTETERHTPVDVSGLASGVIAIAAGDLHTCALTSAGGVKCWGNNFNGQLGDGTETERRTPVGVSGLSSGVTAIDAGNEDTCALTSPGGVKCWGVNVYGGLGDGTQHERETPVDVSGLSGGVTAISAGDSHSCALTEPGAVKCWGLNSDGELGDGTTILSRTPLGVAGFGGSINCGVPPVVGKRVARARRMILRAHCRVGRVTRVTSKRRKGIVVGQSPLGRTRVRRGARVRLEVSRGR